MKILYLGSFFPQSQFDDIFKDSIGVIQNAGNTFQNAILSGLLDHNACNYIITAPMLGSYPKRYKRLKYNGSTFKYNNIESVSCSFINLSLYKIHDRYRITNKELNKWLNENSEEVYIILYSLDLSLMRAAFQIKNKYKNIKVCLIVTDLIQYMVLPKNILSKSIKKYFELRVQKYIQGFDSFVLITEFMKDKLQINSKPYIVMEGILGNSNLNLSSSQLKEPYKTILYSGTLAGVYGITHLLDAFDKITEPDYRLWICGDGDAKEVVVERTKKDTRIRYWGQLNQKEVIELQKRATVLINPRFSESEFTKYSFASKTIEYLASGTPIIMHPLKCLTSDYLNHIYIANDETDEGLKNTLVEVCSKSQIELNEFGKSAFDFVVNEKNSFKQIGRILNLINYDK